MPNIYSSGAVVIAFDQDSDGDQDLFVGGRMIPSKYLFADHSQYLNNTGGKFENKINYLAPALANSYIVVDAISDDLNGDGKADLVVVGEWSNIKFFQNNGNIFKDVTPQNLKDEKGWWSSIEKSDLDNDGDMDFVVGNLGLNYKYKASKEEPFHIYNYDFDKSRSLDIVLGYFNEGVCYPLRGRECSSDQMPFIKEKFLPIKSLHQQI